MKRGSLIRHFEAALLDRFRVWRRIGTHSTRGRRIRRIGFITAIVVLLYGLVGFVGVPLAVYHIVAPKLSSSLHRPVSIGRMRFNPYRLKVDIVDLHVGDRPPVDYSAAKTAAEKTAPGTPVQKAPAEKTAQPAGAEKPAAEKTSDHKFRGKFLDIAHIRVKASWTSLFRLAPVVAEVTVERPRIHLARDQYGGFNFSDLIAPSAPPPRPPAPSAPMKFAVSNIRLSDGDITFDDQMLDEQHTLDKIQIGVPFLANLPADVDIFVQPLLKVDVDGSPLRITGQSKPFQATLESSIDLRLHRLEIPKYLSYVPVKLPVKTPTGFFSCDLNVHFVNADNAPAVKVNGRVAVEKLAVTDWSKVPVLELERAATTLDDVEPLGRVFHIGRIYVDTLATHLSINPDGSNNLAALANGAPPDHPAVMPAPQPAAVAPSPSAVASPAAAAPKTIAAAGSPASLSTTTTTAPSATPGAAASSSTTLVQTATPPPPDVSLESFLLVNSSAEVTDNRVAKPAKLALKAIHADLNKFKLAAKTPAPFNFAANLADGGKLAVSGGIDAADTFVTTDVKIDALNLPPMQAFAPNAVAAQLAAGKLSAQAKVRTDFGRSFNVHVEPATASLDNFEIRAPREQNAPLAWKRISVAVEHVDLAAHEAAVGEVRIEGMRADVNREHNGKISLLELINPPPAPVKKLNAAEARAERRNRRLAQRKAPPPAQRPAAARRGRRVEKVEVAKPETPAAPQWKYTVSSVVVADLGANLEDRVPAQPVKIAVAPLNLHLKDVSGDLSKPVALELDAVVNKTGSVKVSGPVTISPLKADLKVETKQLNVAVANPYLGDSVNATLTNAALTMDGAVALASIRDKMHVKFGGDVALGGVNLLDKLTGDEFVRWQKLAIEKIDAEIGDEKPKVHVGSIALTNFYARLILNSDGKLNLKDITGGEQAAPTSLTRAEGPSSHQAQAAAPPTPVPTPEPTPAESGAQPAAPAETPKPIDADLEISQIVLKGGNINYTDNFIKPNYTANLTQVAGKVGAFGTASTSPADVLLDAQLNDSSPIDIVGSINPLAPMASVDIKAKANGIELTELSAYSTRYTGYPIERGTLTVDVHYNLNQGNLTAENHIFIDQLTFGDRVADSTAANLPIRLAVSLLKNSKGEIDLHVPISGSLNDPQFSLGGVILHVITNLIMRAVTSPFSLIASAMGGSGGEELSYIEFKPGFSTLTPETQKKLDAVAEALKQKEGLKLMITGRVDPAQDRDGLREAAMMQAMKEQKFKDVGSKDGAQDADSVVIDPKEYDKYLESAYKAAKFDKPRNAIGFAKSIPPDEMKKLMLQNAKVTDADLPKLATSRSSTVRRYLSTKVDPVRLFSGSPKLTAEGIEDKGPTTRVELSLQ